METLLVIARFGQFSAAMLLLGSSLFRLGFVAGNVGAMRLDHAFGRWHRPIMITGAAVALASSLVWLDIESGLMGVRGPTLLICKLSARFSFKRALATFGYGPWLRPPPCCSLRSYPPAAEARSLSLAFQPFS